MMDKAALEQSIFQLAVASLTAASGLVEEPSSYGTLRVMGMVRDLVEILDKHDLSSPRLQDIKARIIESAEGSMLSDEERKALLDGLVMHCLDLLD
jgi:hypothetical protein